MQTFFPHRNPVKSAAMLDRQRLGKQRSEGKQILSCLLGLGSLGWRHHTAVAMWRGYEHALAYYIRCICEEWIGRSYRDTVLAWLDSREVRKALRQHPNNGLPPWLGKRRFHSSHRACLLAKDPEHYGAFGWTEKPTPQGPDGKWPYYWPAPNNTGVISP